MSNHGEKLGFRQISSGYTCKKLYNKMGKFYKPTHPLINQPHPPETRRPRASWPKGVIYNMRKERELLDLVGDGYE
jgi:hypothetical protein